MNSRNKERDTIRLLIVFGFIFPYLVGFSPPDTSGNFISLSGGHGTYSYSSCGQVHSYSFYDAGVAADHRINLKEDDESPQDEPGKPDYFTLGVFGGKGYRFQTSSNGYGSKTDYYGGFGLHAALDWKYVGLDLSGTYFPDGADGQLLPGAGLRIGHTFYFSAAAVNTPIPIMMSKWAEVGFGYKDGRNDFWYGMSGNVIDLYSTFRLAHRFEFGTLGCYLQAAPWGEDGFDYGLALFTEVRIPPLIKAR